MGGIIVKVMAINLVQDVIRTTLFSVNINYTNDKPMRVCMIYL